MKHFIIALLTLVFAISSDPAFASLTQTQVSQLYVSIFGRASEGEGNAYWSSEQDNMTTAADTMLNTDAAKNYFGANLNTNQAFIEHIYLNTLSKTIADDSAGIDYWVSELNKGNSRGQIVATLIGVIKDYAPGGPYYNPVDAPTVAAYYQFTNRVTVSDYMADTVYFAPNGWETVTSFNRGLIVTDDPNTVDTAKLILADIISPVASVDGTHLFAWNDLGMHCADSDYSIFTLLPPFNDLTAQLVVNGRLVNTESNSSYVLTYESTTDPTGSINTSSQNKTNFWEYDQPLFGVDLVPDVGLIGYPTPSYKPVPMAWNDQYSWFEAPGIPITSIDDNKNTNYYPMVRVTARDSNGVAIASSKAVLPVSSEINCDFCHASVTGSIDAKPTIGWVNLVSGSEKDWRLNILRLHDEKNAGTSYSILLTQKGYGYSLESSASNNGKPVLCDTCHNSNALAAWGINGETGISSMTAAMHNRHINVSLPGTTETLNDIATRDSCYNCHPGQKTQCLRGAMGNPVDSAGNHTMECQSCHGSMATVGNAAREGWFDMPTCQSCHHDGQRETVAINADGTFKSWGDTRFASNADTPSAGWSLFRFSTGHGKLQCEACHNSTHAEYTNIASASNNQINDNLNAIEAQGYAASIRECTVCHTTMPNTTNGGPHGMHNLGDSWVKEHHDVFDSTPKSSCFYCHGTTSSGSSLAMIKIEKAFYIGGSRSKTFAVDERVTCWSCHNGPNP